MDVAHDGVNILHILLLRVGVIETQIAGSTEFLGCAEVHDERLRVTDMEIAVGLGRKTCVQTSAVLAGCEVILNILFNEVEAALIHESFFFLNDFCHSCTIW